MRNGHLVISRKLGQSFTIGDEIVIEVVSIDRGRVGIAISCPRNIRILRDDAKVTEAVDATEDISASDSAYLAGWTKQARAENQ